ncbi:MAG: hypothetical protein EXR95_04540 [Gemmatimonadetes bacterium]|nr:hypothetical protein [Gemmatimonadota bacterium]
MAGAERRARAGCGAGSGAGRLTQAGALGTLAASLAARCSLAPRLILAADPALFALSDGLEVQARAGPDEVGADAELVLGLFEGVLLALVRAWGAEPPVVPIRIARLLGAEVLLLARRARALDPACAGLGLVEDHLGLLVPNPLVGPNVDELGPRFPDMSEPYDPALRGLARECAEAMGEPVVGGVYAAHPDPNQATAAEYSMLVRLGAQWIGKGGVPEVIVARHMGMRVLSLIGTGGSEERLVALVRSAIGELGRTLKLA